MSRFFHALAETLIFALILLAGGFMIYAGGYDFALRDQVFEWLADGRWRAIELGAVLVLLVMLYAASVPRRKVRRGISFDAAEGRVTISAEAIEDFVGKVAHEFPAVRGFRTEVRVSRKGSADVLLNVKVMADTPVPDLTASIQKRVRECLDRSLGCCEIRRIDLKVSQIKGRPEDVKEPVRYEA